jgi:hypothetical protein
MPSDVRWRLGPTGCQLVLPNRGGAPRLGHSPATCNLLTEGQRPYAHRTAEPITLLWPKNTRREHNCHIHRGRIGAVYRRLLRACQAVLLGT